MFLFQKRDQKRQIFLFIKLQVPVPIPTMKRTTKSDQVRGWSKSNASCGMREMRENMALPAMNVPAHKRLTGRTFPNLSASRPNSGENNIWPRASAATTKPYMVRVAEGSNLKVRKPAVQKCRKMCGLGCVNHVRAREPVTQPSPRIFLHICMDGCRMHACRES